MSESSSSSANEVNCAALLEGESEWSWNVPKECRFNPDIDYGIMTDERDGKVYRTVKIGNQVWMAENLNYADSVKTPSLLERSWCFDDEPKNCDVTGRLYTWAAAIDSVELYRDMSIDCGSYKACTLPDTVYGICPSGWHLPTETEWEALITNIGGTISRNGQTWNSDVGQVLKSKTGWKEWSYSGNGTDTYGFSALPAGIRSSFDGSFHSDEADFWSSTENDEAVWSVWLYYGNSVANLISIAAKYNGCSVRCVKD
ncbi:MAG: fibrobacter succinogenes major paralogous domain-containing protein [Fibrobacter sp.]|uniref:fibrobacter succinogenes major paralogous domain-containing protein n=1 Tax=Fibrobacter sp. TaxID=35828 RepID=UPI002A90F16E|nr:fibrobacter succinogenes major paralogous domain-containing protein [Fibrobacter sp.]MDY6262949.1 fibrobacter succinogenes major paralogous domain-containing protein [Fibrobacter sp.]